MRVVTAAAAVSAQLRNEDEGGVGYNNDDDFRSPKEKWRKTFNFLNEIIFHLMKVRKENSKNSMMTFRLVEGIKRWKPKKTRRTCQKTFVLYDCNVASHSLLLKWSGWKLKIVRKFSRTFFFVYWDKLRWWNIMIQEHTIPNISAMSCGTLKIC